MGSADNGKVGKVKHVDLFSGIGGFALAARWAGYETICFCEKDEWCQRILAKNFGAFVADASGKRCEEARRDSERSTERTTCKREIPIISDIREFDGAKWGGAALLTGGFPCQPFSVAGKRRGTKDDRHLWPEMLRVISEARPRWIIGENVAGFIPMELDNCLSGLEGIGYETQSFVIPACAVDAPHRRDRVWIVAHSDCGRRRSRRAKLAGFERAPTPIIAGNVADTYKPRFQRRCEHWERESERPFGPCRWPDEAEWFAQSGMGRLAHGIPGRVAKLRGLGNAIVPQVAFEIMRAIQIVDRTHEETPG